MHDATSLRAITKTPKGGTRRQKAEHGTSLLLAYREIRELIVHGKLSPGTWILEAELSERLNMSRTPVRGAIQWLQREGYVLEHRERCVKPILFEASRGVSLAG